MTTRDQNISFLEEKKSLQGLAEQIKCSDGKAGKLLICSVHSVDLMSLWEWSIQR